VACDVTNKLLCSANLRKEIELIKASGINYPLQAQLRRYFLGRIQQNKWRANKLTRHCFLGFTPLGHAVS
jgi:hypothetical protein